ncbi:MAG: hypothetical protein IOB84_13705 [Brevundimonas sp.]|nr:hypothetical protein [Brevundimonas sp.]
MASDESALPKGMGRPPQFKDPEPLTIKADRSFWREVDAWAEQQPSRPKRSTAARMLIEIALRGQSL